MPGQKPVEHQMLVTKATFFNGKYVFPGDLISSVSKYLLMIGKAILAPDDKSACNAKIKELKANYIACRPGNNHAADSKDA